MTGYLLDIDGGVADAYEDALSHRDPPGVRLAATYRSCLDAHAADLRGSTTRAAGASRHGFHVAPSCRIKPGFNPSDQHAGVASPAT